MNRFVWAIVAGLALCALGLLTFAGEVQAQGQDKVLGDTGLVRLGPGQVFRVIISAGARAGEVRFRRWQYLEAAGVPGTKRFEIANGDIRVQTTVAPGEAVSFDVPEVGSACGVVVSGSGPLKAQAAIVDGLTGKVITFTGTPVDGTGI